MQVISCNWRGIKRLFDQPEWSKHQASMEEEISFDRIGAWVNLIQRVKKWAWLKIENSMHQPDMKLQPFRPYLIYSLMGWKGLVEVRTPKLRH